MRASLQAVAIAGLVAAATPAAGQVVTSASGANSAAIQSSVDSFRTSLGTLNPNVAGSFGSGRREINWDGVPDALAAPNSLPANFFNVNSPRGVVMSTPGTGFQVSANAGVGPIQFDNINPSYSQDFATFSAQRIFTALGSNVVDINFFVPGSSTPAFVTGFGSVFTDVDIANATTLSFFGEGNVPLGTWSVPSLLGDETLSFLGVLFSDPVISRVRITTGNTPLGPAANDGGVIDVAAMDDFIYGEPRAAVPEPATWAMFLLGFAAIGFRIRRRRPKPQRAG